MTVRAAITPEKYAMTESEHTEGEQQRHSTNKGICLPGTALEKRLSWLVFIRQNLSLDDKSMQEIMVNFEFCRGYIKGKYKKLEAEYFESYIQLKKSLPFFEIMLNTFNQRSSMGSTDALSIIYRDIIIHIFRDAFFERDTDLLQYAVSVFQKMENMNDVLEQVAERYNWGGSF